MINDARNYLAERNESTAADKIIAELNFRFWVAIFSRKYDRLWVSSLQAITAAQWPVEPTEKSPVSSTPTITSRRYGDSPGVVWWSRRCGCTRTTRPPMPRWDA
jgi:hypothetical protein